MSTMQDEGRSEDAGGTMKARLRADLRTAMKDRRADEAKILRALVAALDNAEAPPIPAGQKAADLHHFHSGTAEVERLLLGEADVHQVLLAEIHERECAAAELEQLGKFERAQALRGEAALAKRYLE
jgi:uncharacterized protein YqeY